MEESQAQTQPSLRLGEMLIGVFISPSDTLSQIAQQRPVGAALGFIISLEIIGYLLSVLLPNKDILELGSAARKEFSITSMILSAAQDLFKFIVFVILVHGIIRIFKEEGNYLGAFCALAFARAPIILLDLISILASFSYQPLEPLGPWPDRLTHLASAEIFLILLCVFFIGWIVTLGVMAIRAHYRITIMGAIVAYILAAIANGLLFRAIKGLWIFH